MRIGVSLLVGMLVVTVGASAQEPSSSPRTTKPSSVIVLSGCVTADPKARKGFTLADAEQAQTYRLTGTDVREFVGQHVEVLGALPKRFRVAFGLYPSANVAGQAGAIDPVKAAIASQDGSAASSTRPLAEFKVQSVRVTPGVCPGQ